MYYRITVIIVLMAHAILLIGCSSKVLIPLAKAEQKPKKTVAAVALNSGAMVTFEKGKGGFDVNTRTISGVAVDDTGRKTEITLDFDDVRAVQTQKFSLPRTILFTVGASLVSCVALIAIFWEPGW